VERIVKKETIDGIQWVGVIKEATGVWYTQISQVNKDGVCLNEVHHACDTEEEAVDYIESSWKQKFKH